MKDIDLSKIKQIVKGCNAEVIDDSTIAVVCEDVELTLRARSERGKKYAKALLRLMLFLQAL